MTDHFLREGECLGGRELCHPAVGQDAEVAGDGVQYDKGAEEGEVGELEEGG